MTLAGVRRWTATCIPMAIATLHHPGVIPSMSIACVTATPRRHTPTPRASTSEAHISTTVAIIILSLVTITGLWGSAIIEGVIPAHIHVQPVCTTVDIAIIMYFNIQMFYLESSIRYVCHKLMLRRPSL